MIVVNKKKLNIKTFIERHKIVSEVNQEKVAFPQRIPSGLGMGSPASQNPLIVKTQNMSRRTFLITLSGISSALFVASCGNISPQPPTHLFRSLQEQDRITSLAWSNDSTHLVCGAFDFTAKIWEVTTGKLLKTLTCGDVVTSVAWSPDKTHIASGEWGKHLIRVWNAVTGKQIAAYPDTPRSSNTVAWSYDNRYIAVGYAGRSSADRVMKIWDTTTGQNVLTYHLDNKNIHMVAWSPSNPDLLASGTDDNKVYIWNVKTNHLVRVYGAHKSQVNTLAWSPDGKYIASGSGDYDLGATPPEVPLGDTTIHVWDADTGKDISLYKGHQQTVTTLAWSPSGKYIVSGSADSIILQWDVLHGQTVANYTGHSGDIGAVAWSPDGKYIASGGVDKKILVWQVQKW